MTLITRFLLTALRGLAVAAAVVLLALLLGWTSLQWFVAPRLDGYRPQLTAWASRALDAQVAVQQLSVAGSWWHPVVVAQDLEITDANGQPGLQAARASLRLSPLAWLRGSASALEVDAPEIWVHRNAAGALSVAGVPSAANADGAGWARHLLLLQPAVALQDARLHWLDALHGGELTLDNLDLRMRSGTRRLTGQVTAGQLTARLGPGLPPLHLDALAGTVHWRRLGPSGHHAQVRFDDLNVVVDDGSRLQGVALTLDYPVGITATTPAAPVRVRVSGVDLPVLGRLAQRLPWPEKLQQALLDWPVDAGVLQTLDAQWRGPLHAPQAWQARGQIHGLALAAVPADAGDDASPPTTVGQPGVSGLDVAFETNAAGGHATLRIDAGSLSFPGVFEDPVIPVQHLLAETDWQLDSSGIRVNVPRLELSNADAEGQFSGSWHTGGGLPGGEARLPGFIDLQGRLTRGDGARVHRYLPLVLPADARHYVRDAIIQGRLSDVTARVQGPLDRVPFNLPGEDGIFSIAGRVDDGVMAYVPPRFQDAGEPAWPALTELAGQLVFEGASMRVREASGEVQGHADWAFAEINADIADFDAARVTVDANGSGPLATALAIVRTSPLAAMTEHALDTARASGNARLQLALDLPLDDLPQTTVRGSVQLEQNAVTLRAGVPPLEAARGTISFTETGFALDNVRARTLGGEVALSGGLHQDGQGPHGPARIEARGQASAAGLQHWVAQAEPALGAAWADTLQGEAAYHLSLDLAADGVRALALDSDLQGLALSLPAPLDKPAGDRWPLRLRWQRPETTTAPSQLELQLADRLALQWTLPPGPDPAPRGGTVALGQAAGHPQPPAGSGWALSANLDTLDVDRWMPLIRRPGATPASPDAANRWLPSRWHVTLRHLQVAGHELDDLTTTGQRQGTHWQGELQSPDLAGQVEYRGGGPGQAGHVMGRLSRLRVKPSATATPPSTEPTRTLPSVDLRAEHFFWNDLDLGQLDLQAIQAGTAAAPAWRMNQLRLTTPEARLQASGSRTLPPATNPAGVGQTRLQLELTVDNAGTLLERLAQPGVMAGGAGSVTGELAWPGSPLDFRVAALTGHLQLDLANGRFVQMEPGAGRLFGILSLQALPRRLMLDFTDVFRSGWAFDQAQAHARLNRGVLSTDDLQIQGVGAAVTLQGQTDVQKQTLDLQLRVEPRIDAGAAALAATAINPALGAAAFIAQLALQKPIGRAAARTFRVRGTWSEPEVDPVQASTPPAQAARPEAEAPENRMPAAGENNP